MLKEFGSLTGIWLCNILFYFILLLVRIHLISPRVLFAFEVMLSMWVFHLR